jgi:hypothetical protein
MEPHQHLLPQNKFDDEAVDRLELLPARDLLPLAGALLTWLQDMNWPIAERVARLLAPHVAAIEADILKVFASNDEVWEAWVINCLLWIAPPESITPALQQELRRIAVSPNPGELAYEVHRRAQEFLDDLEAGA